MSFITELRGAMSLREMERITGLSHTYLSSLEKGYDPRSKKERKPTPDTLRKIANAFDVNYVELMIKVGYLTVEELNEYRDLNKVENK